LRKGRHAQVRTRMHTHTHTHTHTRSTPTVQVDEHLWPLGEELRKRLASTQVRARGGCEAAVDALGTRGAYEHKLRVQAL